MVAGRRAASANRSLRRLYCRMTAKRPSRFGPARVFRLGEEPRDDLTATTTPEERLEMVAVLSARMQELSGIPSQPLRRDRIAIRLVTDQ